MTWDYAVCGQEALVVRPSLEIEILEKRKSDADAICLRVTVFWVVVDECTAVRRL